MSENPYYKIIDYLQTAPLSCSNEKEFACKISEVEKLSQSLNSEKWDLEVFLLKNIESEQDRMRLGINLINELNELYWSFYFRALNWIRDEKKANISFAFKLHWKKCILLSNAIKSILHVLAIKLGLLFSEKQIQFYKKRDKQYRLELPLYNKYVETFSMHPVDIAEIMKYYNINKSLISCEIKDEKNADDEYVRFPKAEKFDIEQIFRYLVEAEFIDRSVQKEHFLYWFGANMEKPQDLKPINWKSTGKRPAILLAYFVERYCDNVVDVKIPKWKLIKHVFLNNGNLPNTNSMKTQMAKSTDRQFKDKEVIDHIFDS